MTRQLYQNIHCTMDIRWFCQIPLKKTKKKPQKNFTNTWEQLVCTTRVIFIYICVKLYGTQYQVLQYSHSSIFFQYRNLLFAIQYHIFAIQYIAMLSTTTLWWSRITGTSIAIWCNKPIHFDKNFSFFVIHRFIISSNPGSRICQYLVKTEEQPGFYPSLKKKELELEITFVLWRIYKKNQWSLLMSRRYWITDDGIFKIVEMRHKIWWKKIW